MLYLTWPDWGKIRVIHSRLPKIQGNPSRGRGCQGIKTYGEARIRRSSLAWPEQGQIKAFLEAGVSLAKCGYFLASGIYPKAYLIGPGFQDFWRGFKMRKKLIGPYEAFSSGLDLV